MSEFEKKISEYKEKISNSKDLKELLLISSEIFGKNGSLLFTTIHNISY